MDESFGIVLQASGRLAIVRRIASAKRARMALRVQCRAGEKVRLSDIAIMLTNECPETRGALALSGNLAGAMTWCSRRDDAE
jgi:hypothetical protein